MQRQAVQFVYHPSFEAVDAAETLLAPIDVPTSGLLPVEVERALFLRMNFAKWRASTGSPDAESMLAQAQSDRTVLVERNMRLVKSLTSKLTRRNPKLFDDAYSEGALRLLQSVDLFDVAKKCKFVTFAFMGVKWGIHAVCHADRRIRDKAFGKPLPGKDDVMAILPDHREFDDLVNVFSDREQAVEMMQTIGGKDREIVAALFGLDGMPEPLSIRGVANSFNVSRARIDQRKNRAFRRMREARLA